MAHRSPILYHTEENGCIFFWLAVEQGNKCESSDLKSFGSVAAFQRSHDFPLKAFGCDQPLHITMMFQDTKNFDLTSVLKANFHQESKFNDNSNQRCLNC